MNNSTRQFSRTVLTGLLPLFLASWSAPPAGAAPRPALPARDGASKAAARVEVQKAEIHYKLGRFDEALKAYSRAYEIFNAPALLFNIGQCHRNLKNYERAVFFFQGYLREETRADLQKRTLAEELITESRAELERQRVATAAAEATQAENRRAMAAAAVATAGRSPGGSSAPVSSVAGVFGAPQPPPAAPTLVDHTSTSEIKRPLTRRWWFWTAVGVGTVALAAGVVAYYTTAPTSTVLPGGSVGTLDRR